MKETILESNPGTVKESSFLCSKFSKVWKIPYLLEGHKSEVCINTNSSLLQVTETEVWRQYSYSASSH